MQEKVEGSGIVVQYTDANGQPYVSEAVAEQERGNDGLYRVNSIHSTKKKNLVMRPSERKQQLVEELAILHRQLDADNLYTHPKHKTTKDWLAEAASVLKNLDEEDYQEIGRWGRAINPLVPREARKSAAYEIDNFVRRKVAEYKRHDFSNLDKEVEEVMRVDTPITRGSLRVFVSHSHHDRAQAVIIKETWESYGMEVFVAHEDLTPSLEWEKEIHKFLKTADLFVAIMTKQFRGSLWTDQEAGIAYERSLEFFPVVVDMAPYGFIGKYQGMKCTGGITKALARDMIDKLLMNERIKSRVFDSLVRSLDTSISYDQTNRIIVKIKAHEGELDARRISAICRSWLTNNQVRDAFKAKGFVGELVRDRREDIDATLLPKIEEKQKEVTF